MLAKTRGIVLSFIKYRETSVIAKIFTEQFGLQTYLVNSVRSASAKSKIAYFLPLTLLDLVVYYNKGKDINRISELRCSHNFRSLPFDIRKTTVALFITEMLSQVLKEEDEPLELFQFLHESIRQYDERLDNFQNFHLSFLIQLTGHLGIGPQSGDMMLRESGRKSGADKVMADLVDTFLTSGFYPNIVLDRYGRNSILLMVIDYYRYHFDSIRPLKSIQVLNEVFG